MPPKSSNDGSNSQTKAKKQFTEGHTDLWQQSQSKGKKGNKKSISNYSKESDQSSPEDQQENAQQTNEADKNLEQGQNQPQLNQDVQDGEQFMLPQQRNLSKNNPKYQFCKFISRHYRLIEEKRDRKNHFIRLQPVFVRFLHVLKLRQMPLIEIDTFRKYLKKYFKQRNMRYDETTNRVDMKVVVGIDRRYNSKFDF